MSSQSDPVTVESARPDQASQVVSILAESFRTDPFVSWMCPHPDFTTFFFNEILPWYMDNGLVHISADETGTALWRPPGAHPSDWYMLRLLYRQWRRFDTSSIARVLRAAAVMEKNHYTPPHYYLFTVGVSAEGRGRGTGAALVRAGQALAARDGVPAYLENSNERNRSVYQHLGFEETGKLEVRNGPTIWPMLWIPG